jgi:hypothetical protein
MVGAAMAGAMLLVVGMLGMQGPAPSSLALTGNYQMRNMCVFG